MQEVGGSKFGAVIVASALHWMHTDRMFGPARRLLRPGGALNPAHLPRTGAITQLR